MRRPAKVGLLPYRGPCSTISLATSPWAAVVESDVEKARPGDVDRGDAGHLPQPDGDDLGDLARRPTRPLRQLERDVGGVVAVRPVLRPVDRRRRRWLDDQLAGRDGGRDRSQHGVRNLRGGHSREVIAASRLRSAALTTARGLASSASVKRRPHVRQASDGPDKHLGIERLGEVDVNATLQATPHVGLLRLGRHHHHPNAGRRTGRRAGRR